MPPLFLWFQVSGVRCQDFEPDENTEIPHIFFYLKPET